RTAAHTICGRPCGRACTDRRSCRRCGPTPRRRAVRRRQPRRSRSRRRSVDRPAAGATGLLGYASSSCSPERGGDYTARRGDDTMTETSVNEGAEAKQLLRVLALESIETNLFRGTNEDRLGGRLFGGQVLAQALRAAAATVDGRRVHS